MWDTQSLFVGAFQKNSGHKMKCSSRNDFVCFVSLVKMTLQKNGLLNQEELFRSNRDMIFVINFTQPDFQAKILHR